MVLRDWWPCGFRPLWTWQSEWFPQTFARHRRPPRYLGNDYPWYPLGGLLNYTRTTLLLKLGAGRDYVVLHDALFSRPLGAALNQWYMQDGNASHAVPMANDGHVASIDMGNSTLFVWR